jgi:hypothetical protein
MTSKNISTIVALCKNYMVQTQKVESLHFLFVGNNVRKNAIKTQMLLPYEWGQLHEPFKLRTCVWFLIRNTKNDQ